MSGSRPGGTVNPAPQESPEPEHGERHRYGWQGLAVDGAAAVLGLTSLALLNGDVPRGYEERERLAGLIALGGAVAYGVGSPAVYLLHERGRRSAAWVCVRGCRCWAAPWA